ncbi:MAG: CDP-alcohol phosphatidyltransferase family protein [Phycisphaerae bacterium]
MIGRIIGTSIGAARNGLARGLIALGVTPNALTVFGTALTVCGGVCFAAGVAFDTTWLYVGAGLLVASCACDMLDGAVARIGKQTTPFGAMLDSTMDRLSDFAIFAGISVGFALKGEPNYTFALAAQIAFFNGFMISYTRARAEDLIESCSVGFWQRGERMAAVLIAAFAVNIPALVLQQAVLPFFTAARRLLHTRRVLAGKAGAGDPAGRSLLQTLQIWRHRRMSVGYDITCAIMIAWLIFGRFDWPDPLGMLAGR